MKKIEFNLKIEAKSETVWYTLWDDFYYGKWTNVFSEGSFVKTDWKKGSKIQFLSPDGGGMFSVIEENTPYQKMYFSHKGEIKDFKELPPDEKTKGWAGAMEKYDLTESNGTTQLKVTLDVTPEFESYFKDIFPKGLEIVKHNAENFSIYISTSINSNLEKVWMYWTKPEHILNWNAASDDWHTTKAENDIKKGGAFLMRMEAKDGSVGFDLRGIYHSVVENKELFYTLEDGRTVKVEFIEKDGVVKVFQCFQPETVNSLELQKYGWQAILTNFKKYVEHN